MAGFLESLYPRFPVALQNLGISLYGCYWRRQRLGSEFKKVVGEFRERDRWPVDRMRDYLNATLQSVLRRAFDAPYYRETWTNAGIREADLREITVESLGRLPVLPKQDVRRSPTSFVPNRSRRPDRYRTYLTSGSTGTPIKAFFTRTSHQRFAAARDVRSFGWAGTSILRPRAMIGGRLVVPKGIARPPFYRYNRAEKQVYFSAYHIAPAHIADYAEGFNRYRPEVVTGYAFSQFLIARMMRDQGLTLDYTPVAAVTSSEKLTAPMKDTIRKGWGCQAFSEYGCCENCGLGTECEHGSMHVHPDFGIIEIVDHDYNPVPPGVEGRILCTGLLSDVQFLVRYDIGDMAIWSEKTCPCGRDHLPVLEEITGRLEDVVVGLDGREMVRFHGIFVGLPYVLEGQVVQEQIDEFRVRVVADDGFGSGQVQEIERRFEQRLGRVKVVVDRVDELERNARGKIRAVISRLGRSETANQ